MLNDIKTEAANLRREHPNLRVGQSLFIILEEKNSDMSAEIINTDNDPYHLNDNIDNFYQYIIDNS